MRSSRQILLAVGVLAFAATTSVLAQDQAQESKAHSGLGFGLKGGVGFGPEQFVIGGQMSLGKALGFIRVVPNAHLGFGDQTTFDMNIDFLARLIVEDKGFGFYGGVAPGWITSDEDSDFGLTGVVGTQLGVLLSQGDARCTLALIDCDHFKAVNDRASHLAGDRVLQRIAKVLTQASRKSDLAARFGGDEYAVVFADAGRDEAANVCERIRAAIEQYADDGAPAVTVSIGVAAAVPGDTVERLIGRADDALYRAKAAGRNRVAVG